MDFDDYIDSIAKKYGIKHNHFTGLSISHGIYTGGETRAVQNKKDLGEGLKPAIEGHLIYYLEEAELMEQTELTDERWNFFMQASIGKIALYEWEYVRNDLKVDVSLRLYLKRLMELKK